MQCSKYSILGKGLRLKIVNPFLTSGDKCGLLITFRNSLDPDQAWQTIESDLDQNCLPLLFYSWKIFWICKLKNNSRCQKQTKLLSMQGIFCPSLWAKFGPHSQTKIATFFPQYHVCFSPIKKSKKKIFLLLFRDHYYLWETITHIRMVLNHLCLSSMVGIIQSKVTWFWGYVLLPLLCSVSLISPNFAV